MKYYLRGEIAKMANVNTETLRYYEKNKLIPIPSRTERGYRLYSENVLDILKLIKCAKNAGFTLAQIRELFSIIGGKKVDLDCIEELIDTKVIEINERIEELKDMQEYLKKIKDKIYQPHECALFKSFINDIE